ncbi:hypothetical protein Scep_011311 [Stephania cephalantha]|uniref:E2 ubiquitin-conjugating enzyme n=1 Tax=Stephania cephalantha TaxID=152367 RepID=A0AAP0P5R1_9MAGN
MGHRGGESSFGDFEVMEISEIGFVNSGPKKRKRAQVVPVDIIDVDEDKGPRGAGTFGKNANAHNKGKEAFNGQYQKQAFAQEVNVYSSVPGVNVYSSAPDVNVYSSATEFGSMNGIPTFLPEHTMQGFMHTNNLVNGFPYDVSSQNYDYGFNAFGLQDQFSSMELDVPMASPLSFPEQSVKLQANSAFAPISTNTSYLNYNYYNEHKGAVNICSQQPAESSKGMTTVSNSAIIHKSSSKRTRKVELLKNQRLFKQFDTVQDYSDHFYIKQNSSYAKQPSKNWAKTIQQEWRLLEKDLPDSIFVRVYEERMDILRAVIVGAAGTPYHDGLFFFDFYFRHDYPRQPPLVYYHSGGLRLNPNLYGCGKVCLSLLNTWQGQKDEKWTPGKSTVLQVLLSIQALVLNAKPFFNEPGYERMAGKEEGERRARDYNENTFILSCKTMMYTLRRPPKNFEVLVAEHFREQAHAILISCKAYMEGAQVGCLVGGVQDLEEGDKSCSKGFKTQVSEIVRTLIPELTRIGAEDCEQFLPQGPQQVHNQDRAHNTLRLF